MSQNVEILGDVFTRFQEGDRDSWRERIDPDVIWDVSATALPGAGVYRGHAGVERFFVEWLGAWESPTVENLEMIDAGDSVVSVFRWAGRGRTSGVRTQRDFFAVYDFRDGRIVRYRGFDTRAEALEAAGLRQD